VAKTTSPSASSARSEKSAATPLGVFTPDEALADFIFGEKPVDQALATLSGCRCAAARIVHAMASGRIPATFGQSVINGINAVSQAINNEAADDRERKKLALEERRIAAVEDAQRELARRNTLKETELRILEARRIEGGPARLTAQDSSEPYADTLARLTLEEAEGRR
jgi:hypothetical protein